MSSAQLHASEAKSNVQAKTGELVDAAKANAHAAQKKSANASHNAAENVQEKASNAANTVHEKPTSAQEKVAAQNENRGNNESAGFLQQTGEQVANIAQDAVNNVKITLGIGDKNSNNSK